MPKSLQQHQFLRHYIDTCAQADACLRQVRSQLPQHLVAMLLYVRYQGSTLLLYTDDACAYLPLSACADVVRKACNQSTDLPLVLQVKVVVTPRWIKQTGELHRSNDSVSSSRLSERARRCWQRLQHKTQHSCLKKAIERLLVP